MCRRGCHSHHTADIADYLPRVNYIQITAIKYVSPKKSTKAMHFQLQPGSTMEYFFQYSRCDFCKQWEDKAQHMSTLFLPVPFRINTRVNLCLIWPLLSIWEGTDLLQNMACISLSLYKKNPSKSIMWTPPSQSQSQWSWEWPQALKIFWYIASQSYRDRRIVLKCKACNNLISVISVQKQIIYITKRKLNFSSTKHTSNAI